MRNYTHWFERYDGEGEWHECARVVAHNDVDAAGILADWLDEANANADKDGFPCHAHAGYRVHKLLR